MSRSPSSIPVPGVGATQALRTGVVAALCAGALACALYVLFGDVNLNLADEGYLWYGLLGVLEGEVPFRDFQAYDPGRYRWCVWGSHLFGSGILGVRASVAAFQALGLFFGLLVARRVVSHDLWLVPVALLLGLWMFPRHKMFEPAIAMIAVWFVVRLLERPSAARHLALGVCVGLAGWFGRNHAVYIGVASLAAVGFLAWKAPEKGLARRLLALVGGVLAGYLPMLWNVAFVPGFAGAFRGAILDLLHKGANIPRPFPWPWRAGALELAGREGMEAVAQLATSASFLLLVVALPIGLLALARLGRDEVAPRAALVGATIVGTIYAHHVSVRSDVPHLAQCIQPTLLVVLALPRARWSRLVLGAALGLVSLLAVFHNHTSLRWFAPWKPRPRFTELPVAGEPLRFMAGQARYVQGLSREVAARLGPGDEIFIAPSRPTLYPLLGKRSPVPQIYLFWFAPEQEQLEIIQALEERGVAWVLIIDSAVDDKQELRFANTHPLVWEHLKTGYERIPTPGLPPDNLLLRRR